jgi:hypothetical protein
MDESGLEDGMTQPTISTLWDSSVRLEFPFDRWLIDELKDQIPIHARTYDPAAKAWTITPTYASTAIRLMSAVFPDVEMIDAAAGPTFDRGDRVGDPYRTLHLLSSAPPELVIAAHRCLAKLHHPDHGGDHDAMLAVNAAVDQIRSAR